MTRTKNKAVMDLGSALHQFAASGRRIVSASQVADALWPNGRHHNARGQVMNLSAGVAGRMLRRCHAVIEISHQRWEIIPERIGAPDAHLIEILQHARGLDQYGRGDPYRNHFCTGPGSRDFDACQELVGQGLMTDHGAHGELSGGMHVFSVTAAGDDHIARHSPPAPKVTRSQQRYLDYLNADGCFRSFGEYLRYTTGEKEKP